MTIKLNHPKTGGYLKVTGKIPERAVPLLILDLVYGSLCCAVKESDDLKFEFDTLMRQVTGDVYSLDEFFVTFKENLHRIYSVVIDGQLVGLKKEQDRLQASLDDLVKSKSLVRPQSKLDLLRSQYQELNEQYQGLQALVSEKTSHPAYLLSQGRELSHLEKQNQALESRTLEISRELEKNKQKMQFLNASEETRGSIAHSKRAVFFYQERHSSLVQEIEEYRKKIEKVTRDVEVTGAKNRETLIQVNYLESRKKELEASYLQVQQEIERISIQSEQLTRQISDKESLVKELLRPAYLLMEIYTPNHILKGEIDHGQIKDYETYLKNLAQKVTSDTLSLIEQDQILRGDISLVTADIGTTYVTIKDASFAKFTIDKNDPRVYYLSRDRIAGRALDAFAKGNGGVNNMVFAPVVGIIKKGEISNLPEGTFIYLEVASI
ncbi:MAG: hypothetical protein ABIJ34_05720 [archaeon]